jgi:CHASE3 domain sensor protein
MLLSGPALTLLVLMAWLGVRHSRFAVQSAQQAVYAVEALRRLRLLLAQTAQHRGMANALLRGDASFSQPLTELQGNIARNVDELAQFARQHPRLLAPEGVERMAGLWRELRSAIPKLAPAESFARHTALLRRVLARLQEAGDNGELASMTGRRDAAVAALLETVPSLAETLGQARGVGTGVASAKHCALADRIKLSYLYARSRDALAQTKDALRGERALGAALKACDDAATLFLANLQRELIAARSVKVAPQMFYAQGTGAIDTALALFDALLAAREHAARATLDARRRTLRATTVGVGASVLGGTLWMVTSIV